MRSPAAHSDLTILGSAFGRTGTTSLQRALEMLGFGPCFHMQTIFAQPWRAGGWLRACRIVKGIEPQRRGDMGSQRFGVGGPKIDWQRLLGGYRAAVDWPAAAFYRQIAERFPQVKVIHTLRDPDDWYNSVAATLYPVMRRFPLNAAGRLLPIVGDIGRMQDCIIWQGTFKGRFADRSGATDLYRRRLEEVQRLIPAERLLLYDVRDGWGPLTEFLKTPAPRGRPFPHLNTRSDFWLTARLLTLTMIGGAAGGAIGAKLAARKLMRRPPGD